MTKAAYFDFLLWLVFQKREYNRCSINFVGISIFGDDAIFRIIRRVAMKRPIRGRFTFPLLESENSVIKIVQIRAAFFA